MIRFGADTVIRMGDVDHADFDIEEVLAAGKKKTEELKEQLKQMAGVCVCVCVLCVWVCVCVCICVCVCACVCAITYIPTCVGSSMADNCSKYVYIYTRIRICVYTYII